MQGSAHEVVLYSLMVGGCGFPNCSGSLSVVHTVFAKITVLQRQIHDLFDTKDGFWIPRLLASEPIAAECHYDSFMEQSLPPNIPLIAAPFSMSMSSLPLKEREH